MLFLLMLFILPASSLAEDVEQSFDFLDQQRLNSHLIADIFMENVDQGRISVFGHVLKRSELEKNNIAYIHDLKNDLVSICIRMKVTKKFSVPNFESYYVDEISVDVDTQGKVEQVRSHIKPYKEE